MKKIIKMILLFLSVLLVVIISYFFIGFPKVSEDVVFGVNFSQMKAQELDPNWQETYLAILDDLKVKNIKLASYWNLIEKEEGSYDFSDLDWQIEEAEKRGVDIILVVGRKTPGWPECHIPDWLESKPIEKQKEKTLIYLQEIVNRYKNFEIIKYWQVENEPFFPFGECAWKDEKFLKEEIKLVKSIDSSRKIIISESGEFPLWIKVAIYGDIVGTTMYRKVWFEEINGYVKYFFPPTFYSRKANLVKILFGKEVFCVELQAEPWGNVLNQYLSLEEQEKTMNIDLFRKNINFAKKTNIKKFYLWGAEWWYWTKKTHNQEEIWEEAKKLF